MAHRHRGRPDLGRVRDQRLRHHREAPRAPPLRRDLVLHRHADHDRHAAHLQQPGDARRPAQELLDLRRGPGRLHAVVVRPQRGRLPPDHAVPRPDVLLPAEGGQPPGLLLSTVDHPLLDAGLHLHLGRPAPPALHRPARLGLDPRHAVLGDAVDAVLGRHAERSADPARRLAQGRRGPGAQVLRGGGDLLRHVHLRGPAAVGQGRSTCCRTTPTGPSPTSTPARSAGSAS